MEKRKQFDPECLQKVDEVIFFCCSHHKRNDDFSMPPEVVFLNVSVLALAR